MAEQPYQLPHDVPSQLSPDLTDQLGSPLSSNGMPEGSNASAPLPNNRIRSTGDGPLRQRTGQNKAPFKPVRLLPQGVSVATSSAVSRDAAVLEGLDGIYVVGEGVAGNPEIIFFDQPETTTRAVPVEAGVPDTTTGQQHVLGEVSPWTTTAGRIWGSAAKLVRHAGSAALSNLMPDTTSPNTTISSYFPTGMGLNATDPLNVYAMQRAAEQINQDLENSHAAPVVPPRSDGQVHTNELAEANAGTPSANSQPLQEMQVMPAPVEQAHSVPITTVPKATSGNLSAHKLPTLLSAPAQTPVSVAKMNVAPSRDHARAERWLNISERHYITITAADRNDQAHPNSNRLAQSGSRIVRYLSPVLGPLDRWAQELNGDANQRRQKAELQYNIALQEVLDLRNEDQAATNVYILERLAAFESSVVQAREAMAEQAQGPLAFVERLLARDTRLALAANTLGHLVLGGIIGFVSVNLFGDADTIRLVVTPAVAGAAGAIHSAIRAKGMNRQHIKTAAGKKLAEDVAIEQADAQAKLAYAEGGDIDAAAAIRGATEDIQAGNRSFVRGAAIVGGLATAAGVLGGEMAGSIWRDHVFQMQYAAQQPAANPPTIHPTQAVSASTTPTTTGTVTGGGVKPGINHPITPHWNHPGVNPNDAKTTPTIWDFLSEWAKDPVSSIHHGISAWNSDPSAASRYPALKGLHLEYIEHSKNNFWIMYKGEDGLLHALNSAQETAFKQYAYNLPA